MEREQFFLVGGILPQGFGFVREGVGARRAEGFEHLHAPLVQDARMLGEFLERDDRRPGKDDRIRVDVFEQIEVDALDFEVFPLGGEQLMDAPTDEEIGHAG